MKKKFETKEAFLLDALEYYTTDTNRRCTNGDGGCFYSPKNAGKVGVSEGCLIGRHLTPKNQKLADNGIDTGVKTVIRKQPEVVPQWMQALGTDFLSDCQNLHDTERYWGNKKLTREGKSYLRVIITDHNLDKAQFKKYL